MNTELIPVSKAEKHETNPFFEPVTKIDKGRRTIIAGHTKDILVNSDTGEVSGVSLLHRYKEVDKESFVKLYIGEVSALFDLSKTGLKVFGYVLTALRVNKAEIYLHIPDLMEYCGYKQKNQVYKGLSELITNKIIAQSTRPGIWYINPTIVFNGDRIAFIKEYRLIENPQQKLSFDEEEVQSDSKS